jgi:hypothetical protein
MSIMLSSADQTLRAFCAWCQREGRPAFLGEREPLDDESETHGVCRRHLQSILAALPSQSFPDITYLFVIRPGEAALYDHLERAFVGVRGVKIIMDRRRGERRAAHHRAQHDRRRTDRRQPRGTSHALGYTTVRFAQPATSGAAPIAD